MSVNRYKDHVLVIPEDDANRQLANGFIDHYAVEFGAAAVKNPPGGWHRVLEDLEKVYVAYLRANPKGRVVLLVDFDNASDRRDRFDAIIPPDLKDRVFLLGCQNDPESAKRDLKRTLEQIGSTLADECRTGNSALWDCPHFGHNNAEVQRLALAVKPFLFL